MLKILLLTFVSALSLSARAHPVSFEGAWGVMSYNDKKENELTLNYSFKSYFSAAASFYKFEDVIEATIPRATLLAKRWNNEDSQGNIYIGAGYGLEKSFNDSKGVGLAQVDADWESRKYYVAASYAQFFRQDSDLVRREDIKQGKARAGFAPYLAEYNDLNTWFIAQFKKQDNEDLEITQFVRLFYRNVLIEFGTTMGGGGALNFMAHY